MLFNKTFLQLGEISSHDGGPLLLYVSWTEDRLSGSNLTDGEIVSSVGSRLSQLDDPASCSLQRIAYDEVAGCLRLVYARSFDQTGENSPWKDWQLGLLMKLMLLTSALDVLYLDPD
jgi:hypothetical protein